MIARVRELQNQNEKSKTSGGHWDVVQHRMETSYMS